MNKKTARKAISLLLSLAILVSLLAGLSLSAGAASYAYNAGVRGTDCTSLSSAAQSYWTGSYSFATLNAQSGDTLRSTLRTKITSNRSTVSYDGLKTYFPYTDCYQGDSSKITLFYANQSTSSTWNANSYWNREHIWPQSLGGNAVEGDLHSMRPTDPTANSTRGNAKYANVRDLYPESYKTAKTNATNGSVTAGYYYSNTYFEPLDASKGDAARVLLYDYVVTDSMSSPTVAIKDIDTLLQWHAADPVDEYEMQRNDIVQTIQGCRNPFVDYPELAWRLFTDYTMPSDLVTPSSGAVSYTVSASTNNSSYGTVSVSGYVITATPATGYYASGYTILSGTASVTQNGNTFTVTPSSNCSIRINFAKKTSVTVTLSADGTTSTVSGYAGEAINLSTPTAPSGYTFVGWVTATVAETSTRPATIYTTTYTPSASCTLYALYSHTTGSGSGNGDYVKVTSAPSSWTGDYLIVYENGNLIFNGSLTTLDANNNNQSVTISSNTIPAAQGDAYKVTIAGTSGSYTIQTASGYYIGNTSDTNALSSSTTTAYTNSITYNNGDVDIVSSGGAYLRFNAASNTMRFRYYRSSSYTGQKAVQLYKKDGSAGTTTYTTSTGAACAHTNTANVAAVAATCTAGGYTAGVQCTDCGEYISGHTATAALGHNYTTYVSANFAGHTHRCSRCSETLTEAHTFTSSTSGTTTTFTCSVCHYSYQTEASSYTVTYNDCGSTTTATVAQGGSVTLPATASTVSGYTFAGWVTATIPTETTSAPAVLTGSYTPSGNVTLYALYTRTEAGQGGNTLIKMSAGNTLSDGDRLIIVADGTTVALYQQTVSSSYVDKYTFDGNVNTALADAKNYVTVNTVTGGFTLGDNTNGYLYSSNNNLYCGDTQQTWTLSDLGDGTFKLQGNGRYLSYRTDLTSNMYWRMGGTNGTSGNTVLNLYKIVSGSGSVTCYTTSPTASGLQINSAAPVLNGKIDMTYRVTVPTGYTNPRMVFTCNGASTTVTDYTTESGNFKFTFTGINPQCMGDNITATLYATKNGTTENVSVASYSVKDYCVNKLADNTISASLRKLLSDMLAYGAAAQTYMNYKTNALVTSGVSGTSYSTFTNLSGNAASFDGTADANIYWISAGLTLTDSAAMRFRFHANSVSRLTVNVAINGREQSISTFTSIGGGIYEASFTGISAEEFGDTVTAVFERDSEQVGNELSYSVNAYVQSKQTDSNTALKNLVKALYNYGASAAAYAG